ncbi:unnamed protein product [Amoebophrya sp. A25]|nr:unnamed protein product [Amoebophrya sp. A25]|eukprot:GSA25T00024586001.1
MSNEGGSYSSDRRLLEHLSGAEERTACDNTAQDEATPVIASRTRQVPDGDVEDDAPRPNSSAEGGPQQMDHLSELPRRLEQEQQRERQAAPAPGGLQPVAGQGEAEEEEAAYFSEPEELLRGSRSNSRKDHQRRPEPPAPLSPSVDELRRGQQQVPTALAGAGAGDTSSGTPLAILVSAEEDANPSTGVGHGDVQSDRAQQESDEHQEHQGTVGDDGKNTQERFTIRERSGEYSNLDQGQERQSATDDADLSPRSSSSSASISAGDEFGTARWLEHDDENPLALNPFAFSLLPRSNTSTLNGAGGSTIILDSRTRSSEPPCSVDLEGRGERRRPSVDGRSASASSSKDRLSILSSSSSHIGGPHDQASVGGGGRASPSRGEIANSGGRGGGAAPRLEKTPLDSLFEDVPTASSSGGRTGPGEVEENTNQTSPRGGHHVQEITLEPEGVQNAAQLPLSSSSSSSDFGESERLSDMSPSHFILAGGGMFASRSAKTAQYVEAGASRRPPPVHEEVGDGLRGSVETQVVGDETQAIGERRSTGTTSAHPPDMNVKIKGGSTRRLGGHQEDSSQLNAAEGQPQAVERGSGASYFFTGVVGEKPLRRHDSSEQRSPEQQRAQQQASVYGSTHVQLSPSVQSDSNFDENIRFETHQRQDTTSTLPQRQLGAAPSPTLPSTEQVLEARTSTQLRDHLHGETSASSTIAGAFSHEHGQLDDASSRQQRAAREELLQPSSVLQDFLMQSGRSRSSASPREPSDVFTFGQFSMSSRKVASSDPRSSPTSQGEDHLAVALDRSASTSRRTVGEPQDLASSPATSTNVQNCLQKYATLRLNDREHYLIPVEQVGSGAWLAQVDVPSVSAAPGAPSPGSDKNTSAGGRRRSVPVVPPAIRTDGILSGDVLLPPLNAGSQSATTRSARQRAATFDLYPSAPSRTSTTGSSTAATASTAQHRRSTIMASSPTLTGGRAFSLASDARSGTTGGTPKGGASSPVIHQQLPASSILGSSTPLGGPGILSSPGLESTEATSFFPFGQWLMREVSGECDTPSPYYKYSRALHLEDLLRTPWRLEKTLLFGMFLCLDALLHELTFMPINVLRSSLRRRVGRPNTAIEASERFRLTLLIANTVVVLYLIDFSFLYHYIRSQSFMKLYVFFNMLEIIERLLRSLGNDFFDVLLEPGLYLQSGGGDSGSSSSSVSRSASAVPGSGVSSSSSGVSSPPFPSASSPKSSSSSLQRIDAASALPDAGLSSSPRSPSGGRYGMVGKLLGHLVEAGSSLGDWGSKETPAKDHRGDGSSPLLAPTDSPGSHRSPLGLSSSSSSSPAGTLSSRGHHHQKAQSQRKGQQSSGGGKNKRIASSATFSLVRVLFTMLYSVVHTVMHIVRILLLNIAINSPGDSSAMFLLIVTNNFGELKSTVFKRYDGKGLFVIMASDMVERTYLLVDIMLVLARLYFSPRRGGSQEATGDSSSYQVGGGQLAFWLSLMTLMEVAVDWFKLSFITKANSLPPTTFEYYKDVLVNDVIGSRVSFAGSSTSSRQATTSSRGGHRSPQPSSPKLNTLNTSSGAMNTNTTHTFSAAGDTTTHTFSTSSNALVATLTHADQHQQEATSNKSSSALAANQGSNSQSPKSSPKSSHGAPSSSGPSSSGNKGASSNAAGKREHMESPFRGVYGYAHIPVRRIGFVALPLTSMVICHLPILLKWYPNLYTRLLLLSLLWLNALLLKILSSILLLGYSIRRAANLGKLPEGFYNIKAL